MNIDEQCPYCDSWNVRMGSGKAKSACRDCGETWIELENQDDVKPLCETCGDDHSRPDLFENYGYEL